MIDPSLAVQRAIRARLIGVAAVTALVPAANIVDRHQLPVLDPSIVLGEDQVVDNDVNSLKRHLLRVYSTLHIWKREPSLAGVKLIGGEVRGALESTYAAAIADPDWASVLWRVQSVRYLRDPDGETSHGVMTIDSLIAKKTVPA